MSKGFSVKTAIDTVVIPLSVNYFDDITQQSETINVKHIFKFPTTLVRDGYQQRLVKVTGRKVKTQGTSEASWWLWLQCVVKVENYTDLVIDPEGRWKMAFDTPVLRIHAERAAEQLLQYIDADEGEVEKKFERSSEV
ncbi:MAG: hypothetical protein Q8909_21200 [Bacteroidota bacterium]|nr:hypothetical protein [Bacteroidota bacterium]